MSKFIRIQHLTFSFHLGRPWPCGEALSSLGVHAAIRAAQNDAAAEAQKHPGHLSSHRSSEAHQSYQSGEKTNRSSRI